jgi:sugar lactone lactonase YvrE
MVGFSIHNLSLVLSVLSASAVAGITLKARAFHASITAICRRAAARLRMAPALLAVFGVCFGSTASAQTAHFSATQSMIGSGLSEPTGVAVDGSGNVYIADFDNNRVLMEAPSAGGYTQSTIGTGLTRPSGVAVDGSGNVYIADYGNSRVLKETLSMGAYTQSVVANSTSNGLSAPFGVAVDGSGNVYIADQDNFRVLKESLTAGAYTQSVVANYANNGLNNPKGVAVDGIGNVYIADTFNSQVLLETLSAGSYAQSTVANSTSNGLDLPFGVAVDGSGNVYIADTFNHRALKETPSGGGYTQSVVPTGAGSDPYGIAVDGGGNVYIASSPTNLVLKETFSGGNFGSVNVGSTSSTPISAIFTFDTAGTLGSIAVLTQGATGLDFANAGTGTCEAGTAYTAGETCTVDVNFKPAFAGTRYGAVVLKNGSGIVIATGFLQGTGAGPQIAYGPGAATAIDPTVNGESLSDPLGMAVDEAGDLFIVDLANSRVVEVPAGGGTPTAIDPTVNGKGLSSPYGTAVDGAGNLFIADAGNNRVVEVPAGSGAPTAIDPTVNGTGLSYPIGVALDGAGDLFISDHDNGRVVEVPAGGGTPISIDPTVNGESLAYPFGVAVDGAGDLFIADLDRYRVVEVPAGGGTPISIDPTVNGEGLFGPTDVALDAAGDLFIADASISNSRVVEVPAGGGTPTAIDPTVNGKGLSYSEFIALDGAGDLFIADLENSRVVELQRSRPPTLSFASTSVGSTSSDSPQTVTLANIGNAPLTFPVPSTGNNPSISANFTLDNDGESTCPLVTSSSAAGTLAAGASCLLPISFTPTTTGSLVGALTLTDTNLNATSPSYASQSISLSGTGTGSGTPEAATLISPTLGSTLGISNVQFKWTTGTEVTQYNLWLGLNGPGSSDLYTSGWVTSTSVTVPRFPDQGATIYARLYSDVDGKIEYYDYTYTEAAAGTPATMLSPTSGSTLGISNAQFAWTMGTEVIQYNLWLGLSGPGSSSLYTSGWVTSTSVTVPSLPDQGVTIYARLYSDVDGKIEYNDYTYTEAAPGTAATMISPTSGSALGISNVQFTWTMGTEVTQYNLWLGLNGPGSSSLYTSGWVTSTSVTVPSLPGKGATVYARLYSDVDGKIEYNDYTYTEQ